MQIVSRTAFLTCVFMLFSLICSSATASDEQIGEQQDQINLALRRTADKLLRDSGDSTSRIPAVKQMSDKVWRVYLEQTFSYDTLPSVLEASLNMYDVRDVYKVAIRRCEDAVIDLGYHQLDFLQDSTVPCGGRLAPEGCHYIELTFLTTGEQKKSSSKAEISILLLLVAFIGTGTWWWHRRKLQLASTPVESDAGDWLPFGHSRLHVAGQILECDGVRHALTYREAKLLRLFASHPDQLLERDLILKQVWGDEGVQVGRSVDMFVSRLRKKLTVDPTVGIAAVHGVGYRLETGIAVA